MKIYNRLFSGSIVLIVLFLWQSAAFSQVRVVSWNIENFGQSKSDCEMAYISCLLSSFDVIALQEVVAGYGGAQAVARLAGALNLKGSHWDYSISDPTSGNPQSRERYAFLWKTAIVSLKGKPFLEPNYANVIEREPFMATFACNETDFTIVSFHAVPKSKQPETEIKYLKFLPDRYPNLNLVFAGDFNCPETHTVFNPLKKLQYLPVFQKQKTSLRQKCINNDCLASAFDNMFFKSGVWQIVDSGVIHFYNDFPDVKAARNISDHIPIWITIDND